MTSFFLFIFALAPSFIWLAFYLRKDAHPEPNRMILRIFLAGMFIAIPAVYIEHLLEGFLSLFSLPSTIFLLLYFLFVIALIEEFLKYIVVRIGALRTSALDEPFDVMLYMIISALGFAAFENVLLLFKLVQIYSISEVFLVNGVRFVQAIFLHALVSGLFGYFIALSFLRKQFGKWLFMAGLGIATLLHGLFNFYIFTIGAKGIFYLLFPIVPLLILAACVSIAFGRLKQYSA